MMKWNALKSYPPQQVMSEVSSFLSKLCSNYSVIVSLYSWLVICA